MQKGWLSVRQQKKTRLTKQHKTWRTKEGLPAWKQKPRMMQVADVVVVPVPVLVDLVADPVVVQDKVVVVVPLVASVVALPKAVARASVVPVVPAN